MGGLELSVGWGMGGDSLCSSGWIETNFVDRAGLYELHRNPPASISQVFGPKVCATMPGNLELLVFLPNGGTTGMGHHSQFIPCWAMGLYKC